MDKIIQSKLRQKYNPDGSTIRQVQLKNLEILTIVDEICRRNGITYWLSCGTLLGAIRHKGFIPWDDDIDIEILREDRKRFIDACNHELPSNLHIQCHETDSKYFINILKVRDDSSNIDEKVHLGEYGEYDIAYKYRGVFIDVFCLEPCIPLLLSFSNRVLSKILVLQYVYKTNMCVCQFLFYGMELINSLFRLIGKCGKIKRLYCGYSSCFSDSRDKNYLFPVQSISFEGKDFLAPADPDSYLKDMFGDYMVLPPEEKRFGYHSKLSDPR